MGQAVNQRFPGFDFIDGPETAVKVSLSGFRDKRQREERRQVLLVDTQKRGGYIPKSPNKRHLGMFSPDKVFPA